jgi:hypothetical protein
MQAARTLGFLVYMGGYAALLAWFKLVDVYHVHFATKGLIVLVYNAFRVLFIFYLFWIVYAAGALALRRHGKFSELRTIERLVLSFFAGAGLWHIALLTLGYLNLYTVPVAIAVTLPAVAWTYPDARDALSEFRRRIPPWRSVLWQKCLTVAAIALVGVLLLLIKGLYPGGGHDYYTHYFYYYQEVIAQGGIWPNKVWYHYYYSKGSGLFFLGMLLTDPLAPQLVTFCFMAVAAAALYLIVNDVAPRTNWPTASVLLFVGTYLFTPGWGEFEKDHELKTALILGIIWTLQRALVAPRQAAANYIFASGSAVLAAVIVNTQFGLYLGTVFAFIAAALFWSGERRNAGICAALATWAGIIFAATILLNYITAGLPIDQGITLTWPFADVEKLYANGSLPMVIELYRGTRTLAATAYPLFSLPTGKLIIQSFRLDLFYLLIVPATALAGASILTKQKSDDRNFPIFGNALRFNAFIIVSACAFAALLICLGIGRTQPVSFHRYSTFTVPIIILMGVTLWSVGIDRKNWLTKIAGNRWTPIAVTASCLLTIVIETRLNRHPDVVVGSMAYATGMRSIDDAYVRRGSWGYHLPWGAIYPGSRAAYAIVGPHTPIWSLHVHSYCMLPDCQMESFISFNMTGNWYRVMFGSAEEAKKTLQRAGINYFLYSRELAGPGLGITDLLPLSKLFSPDHIAEHLALRWTDGTTSLLTWPGPDTQPLDDDWIAGYREGIGHSTRIKNFPLNAMGDILQRYNAMPHPWKPIPLPW